MATTKKPYGFRLSNQAVKNLDEIHAITGMTKTAIVEFALAQMRATLKGDNMRTNEFSRRGWLDARMAALALGDYSDTNDMDDDAFEKLVKELETAKERGELNLETSDGVERLAEIYNRHVYRD